MRPSKKKREPLSRQILIALDCHRRAKRMSFGTLERMTGIWKTQLSRMFRHETATVNLDDLLKIASALSLTFSSVVLEAEKSLDLEKVWDEERRIPTDGISPRRDTRQRGTSTGPGVLSSMGTPFHPKWKDVGTRSSGK